MAQLSREEYVEHFNKLPENIQDVLMSIETADVIHEVGSKNKLDDKSVSLLTGLVGDMLMGLLDENDFRKSVAEDITKNEKVGTDIAEELITKIVTPVKSTIPSKNQISVVEITHDQTPLRPGFAQDDKSIEFLRTGKLPKLSLSDPAPSFEAKQFKEPVKVTTVNIIPSATSPIPDKPAEQKTKSDDLNSITTKFISYPERATPTEIPQASVPQQQVINKPGANATRAADGPFIMHKEEEVQVNKEASSPYSVQRPTFYKPVLSEEYKSALGGNKTVRIELGNDEEKPKSSEVYKTSSQGPRVVHYSEFRTEVNPFENQNQGQQPAPSAPSEPIPTPVTATTKPAEVHPNNVIDLKDLPLK